MRALPSGREDRPRGSRWTGTVAYCLAVGAAATILAAVLSLLVDSVVAKRVVWLVVLVGVAVAAGIWRALTPVTVHRRGCAPLPSDRAIP
ncbi:hypothetical protein [Streptomyces sp. CMB-StM0423]|uniref:hypothetical protein n=1 Tax=Streptomyces sp. CMB-StM0423 TaxID=2059884 RepID=UPI00131E6486|nr:hypothetical protein [Streptomyces sp. CMB-StM0423]